MFVVGVRKGDRLHLRLAAILTIAPTSSGWDECLGKSIGLRVNGIYFTRFFSPLRRLSV